MKLYHHKTDGGAEYLFDTFMDWEHNGKSGREGVINDETKYVVRLDGEPELTVRDPLIAAAPDLLACLQRYVAWQQGDFDAIDIELEILEPAKVAIAAATR